MSSIVNSDETSTELAGDQVPLHSLESEPAIAAVGQTSTICERFHRCCGYFREQLSEPLNISNGQISWLTGIVRSVTVILPMLTAVVMNFFVAKKVSEYANPPVWSQGLTEIWVLFRLSYVFIFVTVFFLALHYIPSAILFVIFLCPQLSGTELRLRFPFYDECLEIAKLSFNTVIIALDLTYYFLAVTDNCFLTGRQTVSQMDLVITKGQSLVLLPFAVLLINSVTTIVDMVKPSVGKSFHSYVRLLVSAWKSVVMPSSFFISILFFVLWRHGACLVEIFKYECRNVTMGIQMNATTRYSLRSCVTFPPAIGLQCTTKVATIGYTRVLTNPGAPLRFTVPCNSANGTVGYQNDTRIQHCDTGVFGVAILNTHLLSTSRGIPLEWNCTDALKFTKLRDGVDCKFRVSIQLNYSGNFVYNSDILYRLPESASGVKVNNEWTRTSTYEAFDQIVSDSGETFREFAALFAGIDNRIAAYKLNPWISKFDLLTVEPYINSLFCNRSCFCYKCLAEEQSSIEKNCSVICPDRSSNDYLMYGKAQFCAVNSSEICMAKRVPISLFNANVSKLYTTQSYPNITVWFDDMNHVAPSFDHSLSMPDPGISVDILNCSVDELILLVGGLVSFLCFVILCLLSINRFRKDLRRRTTYSEVS